MLKITEQQNVGHAKYVVSFCTGKKHKDGSDFYDIRIFSTDWLYCIRNDIKSTNFIPQPRGGV